MEKKHYIVLISVHGLIRGENIELGRDADTGGQIQYLIELARELARNEQVGRVDLMTRLVEDQKVSADYAQPQEKIGDNAYIVRFPFGPKRYLRKESLWEHLDSFVDQALQHFRQIRRLPTIIHGHYADAGYVGTTLSHLLEVPFIFTGHSLGRVKRQRLLEKGKSEEAIRREYNIDHRIEAEEKALNVASLVVTSTHQEIKAQYQQYEHYAPKQMVVIPPGVDLERFYPTDFRVNTLVYQKIARFLSHPEKPMILCLSRADERKNIPALIHAYGRNTELQDKANLVIIAGNRENIEIMDRNTRKVLTEILWTIDRYELYGKVAYPKQHEPDEVPEFYRLAAAYRGIFVNPALTEPFGLTLIEAASTGLPIVATQDGGPIDIIDNCKNGLLINPLDVDEMGTTLLTALSDETQWQTWSQNGIDNVRKHYSWDSHVKKYLGRIDKILETNTPTTRIKFSRKLPITDRVIISDIDGTLLGDKKALKRLLSFLEDMKGSFSFGIATGRHLESAIEVLEEWKVPQPDIFITSVGSEIHYSPQLIIDKTWQKHLDYHWNPEKIQEAMKVFECVKLQPDENQRQFKISYTIADPEITLARQEIVSQIRKKRLRVNVIHSHGQYIDILPIRASKGLAIRHLSLKWNLPIQRFLVAGDSGNDEEMLKGDTLGVVVGNYSPELEKLKDNPTIYFAQGHHANGILEGIQHYRFFDMHEEEEQ